ncbi:MAG TPA: hypothetical protein O0X97_00655 [Methanocorpusculum sp.]|nr:hypothetical protein [Methanocorpusculum sp.]
MKVRTAAAAVFAALLVFVCIAAPVSAGTVPSEAVGHCTITVNGISSTSEIPYVLKPNEEGIITITLENPGKYVPLYLEDVYLEYNGADGGIIPGKLNMDNVPDYLYPGKSLTIPMPIKAGDHTGTFYATIRVKSNDGYVYDSIQPIVVKVMDTDADLEVTNIKVTQTGNYCTLTGDVHNLGFDTATSLKITSLEGGDVGPYVTYPIGNLDADDLAGFELSFNAPADNKLTLVLSYKDSDRDTVTENHVINLSNHLVVEENNPAPVIVTIVVVVVIIGLIVFASVRKNRKGKKN